MHVQTSPSRRRRIASPALAALLASLPALHAADLTWTGSINGTWNTSAANWTGDASVFTNGDNVSFTDSGLAPNPTVGLAVATTVGTMTVGNTSGAYTINLTGGGTLTGTTLTKSGAGTLDFGQTGAVTFTNTVLQGGTLSIRGTTFTGGAISVTGNTTISGSSGGGTGTATLTGTALTGAATLTLAPYNGARIAVSITDASGFTGTLAASAAGQINITTALDLSNARVVLSGNTMLQGNINGSIKIGEIQADSGNILGKYSNTATANTYEIGALNTHSAIAGMIQNGGLSNATTPVPTTGLVALTKVGTGDLSLTGANTYTGATAVNAGTLLVGNGTSGSITSAVTVNTGAFYGNLASGNVTTAAVTIGDNTGSADASFGAGRNAIGRFASSAGLTLRSDANFVFDVNSFAGTTDTVTFGGAITLGGLFTLNDLNTGAVNWNVSDSFTVLSGSSITSTFTNLANGDSITVNGITYEASYSANSLLLTVTHVSPVPEPASAALLLGLGVLGTALRRRRRA